MCSGSSLADAQAQETAYYTGDISAEQNRRFFDRVHGASVDRIRITSGGGDVEAGIELGRWVFLHGLDVEVTEYCLSSCANYVFPAGRNKFILPGAVVAWHGNYRHLKETGRWHDEVIDRIESHGEDKISARRSVLGLVDKLVRLETAFFKDINVDEYVCWIGKMPPYRAPDYYFLSAKDMARFGIRNVHTPPGYESTDVSNLEVHAIYLDIRDEPPGP